jgi:protein phosphatase
MIFEGEVDPSQAYRHPLRHLLTRVVGTEEVLEFVDSRIDDIKLGDQFLLCTDGLTGSLNEDSIIEAMKEQSTAAYTAARLVKTALRNGARDNITAIVVTC